MNFILQQPFWFGWKTVNGAVDEDCITSTLPDDVTSTCVSVADNIRNIVSTEYMKVNFK